MIRELEELVDEHTDACLKSACSDEDADIRMTQEVHDKCINLCHLVGRLLDVMVQNDILTPWTASQIVKDEI